MKKRKEKRGTEEKTLNKKVLAGIIVLSLIFVALILFLLFGKSNDVKITFDTNGGSQLNSQILGKEGKLTKPNDPTKEGYIFDGWYVDDEEFDFDRVLTKSVTLVAKWKKEEVKEEDDSKFTVTFNTDGGVKIDPKEVEKDKALTKPIDPTKEGYTFISWQLDGKDFDFSTKITKDITLIATWEKKVTNTTTIRHKITFDSAGGSAVPYKMVDKTKAVSKPANPTRSGYTFLGWYLNNKLYDFSKGVYDNLTLVAKWQQVVSNVTYSINWVKIESSSIGQYTLYIRSSQGNNVSGKVRLTTTAGTTSVVDIPSTGKTYIKSAVADVTVESVN